MLVEVVKKNNKMFQHLEKEQKNDEFCRKMSTKKGFLYHNQILFVTKNGKTPRIVLPQKLINNVLEYFHDKNGHYGSKKTLTLLKKWIMFPKIREIVRKFVKTCDICQKTKYRNSSVITDFRSVVSLQVNELWSVDLFGKLPTSRGGVNYVLVVLDVFTKRVSLCPIKKATTTVILNRLKELIVEFGKPIRILSDQGTQFTSLLYKESIEKWGIKVAYTSVRHPAANPVERVMKELGRLVRAYSNQSHKAWAVYMKWIEKLINEMPHETTGWTPKEMIEGTKSKVSLARVHFPPHSGNSFSKLEVQRVARYNIKKTINKRKQQHRPRSEIFSSHFQEGEKVLLSNHQISSMELGTIKKFHLLYVGPFIIKKVLHFDTVVLMDDCGKERGTFNARHLKKYHERV